MATHMEFKNLKVQKEMIKRTYNKTEKFSSDLVEFFVKYQNGEYYFGDILVDLLFDRESRRAKRTREHECVFYNVIKQ